jgi:hypothetical protein
MSAVYGKGRDVNDMHVHHLKKVFDLCPGRRGLTLHSSSEFLRTEGDKFRGLVESVGPDSLLLEEHLGTDEEPRQVVGNNGDER